MPTRWRRLRKLCCTRQSRLRLASKRTRGSSCRDSRCSCRETDLSSGNSRQWLRLAAELFWTLRQSRARPDKLISCQSYLQATRERFCEDGLPDGSEKAFRCPSLLLRLVGGEM